MQWSNDEAPVGYEYQEPQTAGITIRSVAHLPAPTTLSKANANRITEAVKEIEQREKKAG